MNSETMSNQVQHGKTTLESSREGGQCRLTHSGILSWGQRNADLCRISSWDANQGIYGSLIVDWFWTGFCKCRFMETSLIMTSFSSQKPGSLVARRRWTGGLTAPLSGTFNPNRTRISIYAFALSTGIRSATVFSVPNVSDVSDLHLPVSYSYCCQLPSSYWIHFNREMSICKAHFMCIPFCQLILEIN